MKKYIAIPADKSATWDGIFAHAEKLGISGNDFIGSREYTAKNGVKVFKLDI